MIQRQIMGYLPGFATPRIVCDVPMAGKRWVDQADSYDRQLGVSHWSKSYLTPLEAADRDAHSGSYHYYDPIDTLPLSGQRWWRETRQG